MYKSLLIEPESGSAEGHELRRIAETFCVNFINYALFPSQNCVLIIREGSPKHKQVSIDAENVQYYFVKKSEIDFVEQWVYIIFQISTKLQCMKPTGL